ncbi:MAG: triphosphoribosyl-dephospho-CoA synthase [Paludibacterium sp.]|uniref:triphosphoribosyl-dephospho-CoA synthase n=1 Tax=Paludibacterium sp. TaxID=1917523 RepID=UPI0025E6CA90|nr:triphosphoribosyl-dephospho-CoA synthase [Paludibacterium sp.]MBV8047768.1 triphosphoribosyl-dephospho-CoA synthase [Paludibacterium sp.]
MHSALRSAVRTAVDPLADRLAAHAVAALVDEAELSPKPGLVDSRGSGAHSDLTLALMRRSAATLGPTFLAMALEAQYRAPGIGLREALGAIGRDGEAAMMHVTQGVNTHRGAIWALGLLVAAAAMRPGDWRPDAVAARAAALARLPDRGIPPERRKGDDVCKAYGIRGARGEAQDGFPHVLTLGLPTLLASRRRGCNETAARLNALLAMMTRLVDTCVLSRGGLPALESMRQGACRVLNAGGVDTLPGRRALMQLDQKMLELRASPGGAADLLAATLLLDRLVSDSSD